MEVMESKGYTLWLMPKGKIYDKFSGLIKKLAKENIAPLFQPHITLLGEIMLPEEEVIGRTERLVLSQKPFPVTLQNIDYQDFYFRTLFVRAKSTNQLQALHNRAKEIFRMDIPPYMPHLSLLYGNFPVEVKEKIIAEIGRDQLAQFEVESVHLIKGGAVGDWKIVREFSFE